MYIHIMLFYNLPMQVSIPLFQRGDVVRVIEDMAEVFSLQKGHGEWVDDMALVRESNETTIICTRNELAMFAHSLKHQLDHVTNAHACKHLRLIM